MIKSSTCSSSESAVIQQVGACLICENFREQPNLRKWYARLYIISWC
jgi:hypothetical protein